MSLDTLCFHLAIVAGIAGLRYYLNANIIAVHLLKGIPDFTVAYLIALIFFFALRKTPVYDYIDTNINQKISGTATDYLVFSELPLDQADGYCGIRGSAGHLNNCRPGVRFPDRDTAWISYE